MLLTKNFGSNENVVNYLSFVGTIVSIILAVLAIIYSYFQTYINNESSMKMIESVNRIEHSTRLLEDKMSNINNSVENVDSNLTNFSEKYFDYLLNNTEPNRIEAELKLNNNQIENFALNQTIPQILLLYLFMKLDGRNVDSKKVTDNISQIYYNLFEMKFNKTDERKPDIIILLLTNLNMLQTLNIFEINNSAFVSISIKSFNTNLKNLFISKNFLKKFASSKSKESTEALEKGMFFIDSLKF